MGHTLSCNAKLTGLMVLLLLGLCGLNKCESGAWPRPNALVLFAPFDNETGTWDIVQQWPIFSGPFADVPFGAKLMTGILGPFAMEGSSYTIEAENYVLGVFNNSIPLYPPLPKYSFTYSFHFYTEAKGTGGMLLSCWNLRLSIGYANTTLVINSYDPQGYYEVFNIEIPHALNPSSWNFAAVTYDASTQIMNVFSKGVLLKTFRIEIPNHTAVALWVGAAYRGTYDGEKRVIKMKTTDAIACLMVYNETLKAAEIAELPYVCMHKGKPYKPTTTTSTTLATTTTTPEPLKPCPAPESLLCLWPMSRQYRLQDLSENHFRNIAPSESSRLTFGPFGGEQAALEGVAKGNEILEVVNRTLSTSDGSFTVSLFFKIDQLGNEGGGLFEFLDISETDKPFQFRYENSTSIELSANGLTIGHYTMIQPKGAWTYAAFTFDAQNAMLTVYSKHGRFAAAKAYDDILVSNSFNNNGFRLGYATRWNQGLAGGDAVSCLAIYRAALGGGQIRDLYESCRLIHGTAPCGTPKLPFSPIPMATTMTTLSKAGQFPWVASLRLGSTPICGASILDEFWLLTSATCFQETNRTSAYSIFVGEHDLSVSEAHTRKHRLSKIIFSGKSKRDIALIQVEDPIDLSNEYVNDACLFNGDTKGLKLDQTEYLFGWGLNGRSPLVSQSLPRYSPGAALTDKQCLTAWGSEGYKPGQDFCFLSSSMDKDTPCSGDEGGPLLVQAEASPLKGLGERLIQLGVYYGRSSNCSALKPGLFTNMAPFSKWIAEKLACAVPGISYPAICPK